MRIVFMGTPEFAVSSLERLLKDGHEIAGVFTQPDKPQGRKMKLTKPPVKLVALEQGIPVFQPDSFKDESQLPVLKELAPEAIVVVAYGKLLPEYVLNFPKFGCINVHGSLLPKYRGAAPIQWSVLNGDKTAGVTTMYMDKGLDTGDMILKAETPIEEYETTEELYKRLADIGAGLLSKTIAGLASGTLPREKQDDSQSCYAPMLKKEMSPIDWTKGADEILHQIHGLNPWPVASAVIGGEKIKVFRAVRAQGTGEPGKVIAASPKTGLLVACGNGALELTEVQAIGGKRMQARDYLRGHPIKDDAAFSCI